MAAEWILALQTLMKQKGVTIYLVPTADYHESEYVSDYFKTRKFLTGFTGSAGTAVITQKEAGLWTDGRYFIQAEKELQGTGIRLFKSGMEGVPTIREYLKEHLEEGGCLGFDGRVVNFAEGEWYANLAKEKGAKIKTDEDLVGILWKERPKFPTSDAYLLWEKHTGKSTKQKLFEVRECMKEKGTKFHLLSDACDIAWLLNIRGNDIPHVPVILSYLLMDETSCIWYVKKENLSDKEVQQYLKENQIEVRDYEQIYSDVCEISNTTVLADLTQMNYQLKQSFGEKIVFCNQSNPENLMKAIKNPVEVKNIKKAHLKDGIAVTKFMYWLKTSVIEKLQAGETVTEMDAANYLHHLRKEQENFLDESFDTISAYGANAAMMHYQPSKEQDTKLSPKGFLLVDSGGHYLEGSTDITRTIALGPLTEEEKTMFTAVARGNLNLANAKFLHGCVGLNLDILARLPLWQMGVDYRCGTGHGNGYLLNVHEGPNGFRWKMVPERMDSGVFEEGMLTTDEPGVYVEGHYGIRTENELICKKAEKNEYGQFMKFETITYAPIDLDAIVPEQMTETERKYLNDYHKMVYETVSSYLKYEERVWLEKYTREI